MSIVRPAEATSADATATEGTATDVTAADGTATKGTRVVHRTCPLCEATCGLSLTLVADGSSGAERVTRVEGDREDPFSRGFLCPKGAALGALHHDPDRLRRPRIRTGNVWREVDWPEAFAAVDAGLGGILAAGDRDAIALYAGNPTVHSLDGMLYGRALMRAAGTRNLYSASTVDQMPKHVACGLMFGDPDLIAVPDLDRCDLLIVLGANPLVSNGSLATAPDWPGRLAALQARGGRLVVVDPRRTETAAIADEHLAIRPGADALLLLAMVEALVAAGRVDCGRLAPYVIGLDRLAAAVAPFSADAVAAACGIGADVIRRLAFELADTARAAVYGRIGTQAARFGTVAAWAVDLLNLVTGHLDVPGGAMFPSSLHDRPGLGRGRGFKLGRHHSRVRGWPEVKGELPAVTLVDEIETPGAGQVRALITVAGNPVLSVPGGPRLDRALASLEFMVSVDPYLNETTRHAHVILPPPSPLMRSHYDIAFYRLAVRQVARFTPPSLPREGPSEGEILARLALCLAGHGGADPAWVDGQIVMQVLAAAVAAPGSVVAGRGVGELVGMLEGRDGAERILDALIRTGPRGDGFGAVADGWSLARLAAHGHGVDFGALVSRLPGALATVSGGIEVVPDVIGGDLARLKAWMALPAAGLVLIGRRHLRSNNSWMHNLPKMVAGRGRCALWMHPDDAAARGVAAGDRVRLSSVAGAVEVEVALHGALSPGVVSLPHGWGHGVEGSGLSVARVAGGVSVNVVIPAEVDPLSGTAVLNGVAVEVVRVG